MVLEIRFSVSEEKARFLRSRLVILQEFTRTFPLFLQLFSLNNSSGKLIEDLQNICYFCVKLICLMAKCKSNSLPLFLEQMGFF